MAEKDTVIIVAEKPDAMTHIAKALAERGLKKKKSRHGVDYYEFYRHGKRHVAVAAVGHLFNLKQKATGFEYPVFDGIGWMPSYKAIKRSAFSKKYFKTIQEVMRKNQDAEYISACDYDNEGSLIAANVLRFICKVHDAKRMRFSTLTKEDLIKSYENMSPHLDWENIECGETRHYLDFYYGINTSRALISSIKRASPRFAILSAGRVQGPVLSFLAEREKQIMNFKPKPYWELEAKLLLASKEITAKYTRGRFWNEGEAKKIHNSCKGKMAVVDQVTKTKRKQPPPVPFNITSLQTEAYRLFGYSPQQTLNIAQDLYTSAYISYPRSSSQKLPPQIGYKEILQALIRIKKYEKLCKKLLALPELKPVEGKLTDPAHEAIRPTTEPPKKKLKGAHKKIYDLICRRFFSVFAKPAIRESIRIVLLIGNEPFALAGIRTIEENWIEFYGPYAKFDEVTLPDMHKGDKIEVHSVNLLAKETTPPNRYSQASTIKEMEKKELGTRATRAAILQTLYERNYIQGKSIQVTKLGMAVAYVLRKYVPDLVDEKLTRKFEHQLEKIFERKIKSEKVLADARRALIKICKEFKNNEQRIGKELGNAIIATQLDKSILGPCPDCGGDIKRLFSPRTKKFFAGCSNYPKCKRGYPLPHGSTIEQLDKVCERCNSPIIRVLRKGKRPFNMCLDPECETKAEWGKEKTGKKAKVS